MRLFLAVLVRCLIAVSLGAALGGLMWGLIDSWAQLSLPDETPAEVLALAFCAYAIPGALMWGAAIADLRDLGGYKSLDHMIIGGTDTELAQLAANTTIALIWPIAFAGYGCAWLAVRIDRILRAIECRIALGRGRIDL